MSYAKIIAKKIRMCARFGHLPECDGSRRIQRFRHLAHYFCRRCGADVPRAQRVAR